ncbi:uncharacterized protein LOC110374560 [Helicoverpa armigera]|uniref:uncharacterized protein LOC110374560 n=1 Tax=Helicoverpa armigera TaxID=29058 RepID=UPI003083BB8D
MNRLLTFESYCEGTKNWEHFYDSYSSVGYVPKLEAKILKYVFKLENFDNNTYVRTRISLNEYFEKKIMISDIPGDIGQLMFTDTTDVMFDCGQHLNDSKYVYVGLINTTANKLTTMNTTTIMTRYSETYDGSILCCLFYKITGDSNEMSIERFISNKTLLRYYANDKIENCLLIVIMIATAATLIFVVVAIILIRKRCLNNNSLSRRPKLALPKKERKNPFYLNLLFRKECEQEIRAAENQKEELHYEEIL